MNVSEWYNTRGETVISADGRGSALIGPVSGDHFSARLSDEDLDAPVLKPGSSIQEQSQALENELLGSVFKGNEDIRVVVDWFLERVAYSDEDRRQIVGKWEAEMSRK